MQYVNETFVEVNVPAVVSVMWNARDATHWEQLHATCGSGVSDGFRTPVWASSPVKVEQVETVALQGSWTELGGGQWETETKSEHECQELRCCSDSDLRRGSRGVGKKTRMLPHKEVSTYKKIVSLTVVEKTEFYGCVRVRVYSQYWLTVKCSFVLLCLQSAGFDTRRFLPSCPPTVTFIISLPGGNFLSCRLRFADVSDEVRHQESVGESRSLLVKSTVWR